MGALGMKVYGCLRYVKRAHDSEIKSLSRELHHSLNSTLNHLKILTLQTKIR